MRYKTTLLLKQTRGAGTTGTHVPSGDGSDRVWVPQNQGTPPHARARARLQHTAHLGGGSATQQTSRAAPTVSYSRSQTPWGRTRGGEEAPRVPARRAAAPWHPQEPSLRWLPSVRRTTDPLRGLFILKFNSTVTNYVLINQRKVGFYWFLSSVRLTCSNHKSFNCQQIWLLYRFCKITCIVKLQTVHHFLVRYGLEKPARGLKAVTLKQWSSANSLKKNSPENMAQLARA